MDRPYLPNEILFQILSFIPDDDQSEANAQRTLHSLCITSRQWYDVAIGRLYEHPRGLGDNNRFELFYRTICPSVIIHVKKSELSSLVKVLDLGRLVHHSSKKMTARLIGRTKASLETFIAPQASFAINSFPALAHCICLHKLDLSLVCESISFIDLGKAIRNLPRLEVLYFPRTGVRDEDFNGESIGWPSLTELHMAGGLSKRFMKGVSGPNGMPTTLTSLSVANSPALEPAAMVRFMASVGPRLRNFTTCLLPKLRHGDLDDLLIFCPALVKLSVAAEFLTSRFCSREEFKGLLPHPLQELRVTKSSDAVHDDDLTPLHVEVGVEYGFLTNLRRLRVNKRVGWSTDRELKEELDDLEAALDTISEEFSTRKISIDPDVENNHRPDLEW